MLNVELVVKFTSDYIPPKTGISRLAPTAFNVYLSSFIVTIGPAVTVG